MAALPLPFLHGLDAQSIALIAQLQGEDIEALEVGEGKGREDDITEIQLFGRETVAVTAQVAADRYMAMMMSEAVEQDGRVNANHEAEQDITTNDNPPAQELASGVNQTVPTAQTIPDQLPTFPQEPQIIEDSTEPTAGSEKTESPSNASSSKTDPTELDRSCSVCLSDCSSDNICSLPCEHDYCKNCLQSLLERCTKDESLFPPRCCKIEIDSSHYLFWLPADLLRQLAAKREEYSTIDKTYCHRPTCSTFITPSNIANGIAACPKCHYNTCHTCKAAIHFGDCTNDTATKETLDLAKTNGWKRCPKCSAVVELTYGCYHITCRCGKQFCYLCAETWKTCKCVHWDERNLWDRAQEVVARNQQGNGGAPPNMQQVRAAVDHLRDNHNCDHHGRWTKVHGHNRCDTCGDMLWNFVLRCPTCGIQACADCRRNRL